MKKLVLALMVVAATMPSASYGAVASIAAGNWSDATIWSGAAVPTASDDVIINTAVTADIDIVAPTIQIAEGRSLTTSADILCDSVEMKVSGTFTVIAGTTWKFTTAPGGTPAVVTRAYTLLEVAANGVLNVYGTLMADDDCNVAGQSDYLLDALAGSTVNVQGSFVDYATINTVESSAAPFQRVTLRNYQQEDVDAATHVRLETGPFKGWTCAFTDEGSGSLLLHKGKIGDNRVIAHVESDSLTIVPATGDSLETYSGALMLFGGDNIWEPEDADDDGIVTKDDVVAAQFSRSGGDSIVVYVNSVVQHDVPDSLYLSEGIYPSAVVSLVNLATIAGGETAPTAGSDECVGLVSAATNLDWDYWECKNLNTGAGGSNAFIVNNSFTFDYGYFHDSQAGYMLYFYTNTSGSFGAAGTDSVFVRDCYFETNLSPFNDGSDGHALQIDDSNEHLDAFIVERCGFRRLTDDGVYFHNCLIGRGTDLWHAQSLGLSGITDTGGGSVGKTIWLIRPHSYAQGDQVEWLGDNGGADSCITVLKVVDPYITRPGLRSNRDTIQDTENPSAGVWFRQVADGSFIHGGIIQWGVLGGLSLANTKTYANLPDSVIISNVTIRYNGFAQSGNGLDWPTYANGAYMYGAGTAATDNESWYIFDSCIFQDNPRMKVEGTLAQRNNGILMRDAEPDLRVRECTFTYENGATTNGPFNFIEAIGPTAGAMELYGNYFSGNFLVGAAEQNGTNPLQAWRNVVYNCGAGGGQPGFRNSAGPIEAAYNTFINSVDGSNNADAVMIWVNGQGSILFGNLIAATESGLEPVRFTAIADTTGLVSEWNAVGSKRATLFRLNTTGVDAATWAAAGFDVQTNALGLLVASDSNPWQSYFGTGGDGSAMTTSFRPLAAIRDVMGGYTDDLDDIGAYKYVK